MTITQIANEIFSELGSPTSLTPAVICYWLRSNVGMLNSRIGTYYHLDASNQITSTSDTQSYQLSPDFDIDEAAIFKQLYKIYYYALQMTNALGAAALDPVVEVSENGVSVRTVSRNELAKTFRTLKNDEEKALSILVAGFKRNKLKSLQVSGDDTKAFYNNPSIKELNRRR